VFDGEGKLGVRRKDKRVGREGGGERKKKRKKK